MRGKWTRRLVVTLLSSSIGAWFAACSGARAVAEDAPDSEKAAAVAEMYQGYTKDFPDVRALDVEQLDKLQKDANPVLVDVRTPEEQAVSMIPGAVSRQEFEAHPEKYADRPVVTYCTIGYRSGLYAEELTEAGRDAYNLAGSILAWAHAQREFVTPDGTPTRRLHVYGKKWDLAPHDYETIW